MDRYDIDLPLGHGIDQSLHVIRYGHYGRPVVVFPSEAGRAWDFENNGMVQALRSLIDGGRIKLYCVDSLDAQTWSDRALPIEERARRHGVYTRWLTDQLVPFVHADSSSEVELITTGCSLGAYHAVHFTLQQAELAPLAIGLSGNYDVSSWNGWGERGEATYSPTRSTMCRICTATIWTGFAVAPRSCSRSARAPGRPTRREPYRRPSGSRVCCRSRGCSVNSMCGGPMSPMTGPGGVSSWRIICRGSADVRPQALR